MLQNKEITGYTYAEKSVEDKIKDILIFAFIGLLLGRVAMFGVIDSFFMAYIGAFYVCSIVPYPGIVGVVLSLLTMGEQGIVNICIAIGSVFIFEAIKKIKFFDKGLKYIISLGVYYALSGVVIFFLENKSLYSIIYIALNTVVVLLLTPVFSAGISVLRESLERVIDFSFLKDEASGNNGSEVFISAIQMLGCVLMGVLSVVGIGKLELFGINFLYIVMMYIVIVLGAGLGMAFGAVTGTILSVAGYAGVSMPIDVMVLIPLVGTMAGILRNKGRIWIGGGVLLTVLIFKTVAGTNLRVMESILECTLACIAFVCVGPKIMVGSYKKDGDGYVFYTAYNDAYKDSHSKYDIVKAELIRIKETADSMKSLSFERLGSNSGREYILKVMNEAVEGICFNCSICRTCTALRAYREASGIKEPKTQGELIVDANENECVVAMLMRATDENSRKMIDKVDRYKTVPSAVAEVISKSTELSMNRIDENRSQRVPLYKLSHSQISIPTSDSPICGDTGSITDVPGNKTAIIVSDGCGSGLKAYEESSGAVRLIEGLVSRGAEMTSVIDLVNALMGAENDDDAYATADILIFDNETGEGEIYKLSAVPTFIIHKNKVYTVSAQSGPLGILDKTYAESAKIRLCYGDTVVMMTDGILDIDKEKLRPCERICRLLKSKGNLDPESICNIIVEDAIKRSDGAINDDMFVVCARVERARAG